MTASGTNRVRAVLSIFICLIIAGCTSTAHTALTNIYKPDDTLLDNSHLELFASWIERSWDNIQQIEDEMSSNLVEFERHQRYAMRYTKVATQTLPGLAFAIENYDDGNGFRGAMQRVSLHHFMLSENRDSIVHEIILIKDPVFRSRLKDNLNLLEEITAQDIKVNKNCRLYWRWTSARFEGATKKDSCITNSYSNRDIRVEGSGTLEQNRFIRHDRNFEMTGEEIIRPGHQNAEVFLPSNQIN